MKENNHKYCPIARVAILLSDPWTMLIIRDLLKNKRMRFSDLENSLSGISTRTLTKKIKKLEEDNIIKKENHLYYLTKKGLALDKIIMSMLKYGKKYFK